MEAKQVDVAAKEALRVKEILVKEGDLTQPGQVVVRMDTATLESELAEAKANVAAAKERVASANWAIVRAKSLVEFAKVEESRYPKLIATNAASREDTTPRKTSLEAAVASLVVKIRMLNIQQLREEVKVATANVATIQQLVSTTRFWCRWCADLFLIRLAKSAEESVWRQSPDVYQLEYVLYGDVFTPSERRRQTQSRIRS